MRRHFAGFRMLALLVAVPWFSSSGIAQTVPTLPDGTAVEPIVLVDSSAKETAVDTSEAAAAEAAAAETAATEAAATGTAGEAVTAVTDVSEESVKKATEAGKDVVVKDETSSDELKEIADSEEAGQAAAAVLDTQPAVTTQTEVITKQSTRSSSEEAIATTASGAKDKDDKNQVWKYLGAAAVGVAVGALIPQLGDRVVQDQGDRLIVEREGEFYVRKDENLLLRRPGVTEETEAFADGITRSTVTREDGSRIVTVRDSGGSYSSVPVFFLMVPRSCSSMRRVKFTITGLRSTTLRLCRRCATASPPSVT